MTAPIPEDRNEPAAPTDVPPGEHESELTGSDDGSQAAAAAQAENAETSEDQPST